MTRPETGVFKPEGDWPGIFIRGDEALGLASLYRAAAKSGDAAMMAILLNQAASMLEKCKATEST